MLLKPGMRTFRKIKSVINAAWAAGLALCLLGCSLPKAPTATVQLVDPVVTSTPGLPQNTTPTRTPVLIMPTYTLTPVPTRTATQLPPIQYVSQSGDTLPALAVRFGVDAELITSDEPVPATGFLNPGQILVVPNVLGKTGPLDLVLPDTEIVFSPTTVNFDIEKYVKEAGGYLSTYHEYVIDRSLEGWQVVLREAQENSINPRLLLALLEQESGWVYGHPQNANQTDYPMGWIDINYKGLNRQLKWVISQISIGYYGWRSGGYSGLYFPDGSSMRMAPQLNAGTAAVQYFYSRRFNEADWYQRIYSENGIGALYERMFGDPWQMSSLVGPMFSADLVQPVLSLPIRVGRTWAFTGGPHPAWGEGTPYAAIDLAPFQDTLGCATSTEAVIAVAPGFIVRTGVGEVMEDLDGDGYEQTGWDILYMHVGSQYRIAQGAWVDADEFIGRPSCEGGVSTGTHLHIARKYNGEWMLADGPLPFVMDGWTVHAGTVAYKGYFEKNGKLVRAAVNGDNESEITR